VLPIASMMLFVGVAFSGVLTFVAAYAVELDLAMAASAFFLVYSAVILVSRLFVGRIHDTHGDNSVVYPALISLAAGLVVLATASTTTTFLVAGGLLGLGVGTLMAAAQVIAVSVTPAHRVGLATSTFFLFMDVGAGVGPLLLGLVIHATGLSTMYLVLAGVVGLAALMYHWAHGRRPRTARVAVAEQSA
jgi:MFS family permease